MRPTAISESAIPFPLPTGVTGYRFTDTPPPDCGCPPTTYDKIDLQVGRIRIPLDLFSGPLPRASEVSIITNALARLAASERVTGMARETRFAHPQAINAPNRQPGDFGSGIVEAGGTGPAIPWKDLPSDGQGSLAVIPGGVAFTVDGYHQEWLSAPIRGFTYDQVDATVKVSSGVGSLVGLGCESDKDFHGFDFAIADPDIWTVVQLGPNGTFQQTLMRGTTSVMRPSTSLNQLSTECDSMPSGQTRLIFAVNGTVVAETTIVAGPQAFWVPGLYIYGLRGPATADFTNIVQTAS
jgi:hypothetical protein